MEWFENDSIISIFVTTNHRLTENKVMGNTNENNGRSIIRKQIQTNEKRLLE